jgi:hypothetical protein
MVATEKKQPRGIVNNNPGNVEWGQGWQGLIPREQATDERFAQFKAPAWGIRTLARVLIAYYDTHQIKTVRAAITRWAPPSENNTEAYVTAVASAAGVAASEPINFHDYECLRPMVEAIIRHENGNGPLKTLNSWYDTATIDEGLRLAGVVKVVKATLLTKQGAATGAAVAATSVAAVAQIASSVMPVVQSVSQTISPVVQAVTPVVQQVQTVSSATEGLPPWLRVTILVLTLVAAGAAAYAFWNKRREVKAVQS